MAVRRCKKEDLKRIAKATGGWSCDLHCPIRSFNAPVLLPPATLSLTLANLEGEESFDPSMLGQAEEVVQERVCDDELILIKG